MRERMLNAPAWVLAVVNGTLFGVFWAGWTHYGEGDSWTASLVQGSLLGLFFGAVMGPVLHRQQRGVREAAARSPEGLSKRVRRAAWRGPAPQEPEVRAAARDVVLAQLAQYDKQRVRGPIFCAVLAVLSLYLAVVQSPWHWLGVLAWSAAAAGHLWVRSWLRRRADLLRPDGSVQPA